MTILIDQPVPIAPPSSIGECRILLVEDNPGDAQLIVGLLESFFPESHQVVRVERLSRALEVCEHGTFSLALLDLNLPDSRGLDTFRRLFQSVSRLPIVILTGENDQELSMQAVRLGAQDFLCKDLLNGGLLVRTIRHAIERHAALLDALTDATTDALTGLNNRRGLTGIAAHRLAAARRLGTEIVLLSIDLDGLKPINDQLGHEAGDRALLEAADVLRETFRESDVLARLGGDEFAVLAFVEPSGVATSPSAETLIARLQETIHRRNAAPGRDYQLQMSVGFVQYDPTNATTLEQLLAAADARMYEQKRNKRLAAIETGQGIAVPVPSPIENRPAAMSCSDIRRSSEIDRSAAIQVGSR